MRISQDQILIMKERSDKILEWAMSQVAIIVSKFASSENKPVHFHDFDAMGINVPFLIPEPTDQHKGGELIFQENGTHKKVIQYHMYKGAVLDVHHHPDFIEYFDIKKGKMLNEISGIEYGPNDTCVMFAYEAHQFRWTEDAFVIITCQKI